MNLRKIQLVPFSYDVNLNFPNCVATPFLRGLFLILVWTLIPDRNLIGSLYRCGDAIYYSQVPLGQLSIP